MAISTSKRTGSVLQPEPTADLSVIAAHGGTGPWLFAWFVCFIVAWFHVMALNVASGVLRGSVGLVVFVSLFAAVPVLTAVFVPQSRRGWWRWLVLLILSGLTAAGFVLVVLLAGEATLIHRAWVSERQHGFVWAPRSEPTKGARRGRRS